ncbi:MAG: FkbM family methyltransferase [Thermodesulfobacteriota bacterium]|nr:FkbM family methyltransferase [Thermodesulfobacteriota bacterium]
MCEAVADREECTISEVEVVTLDDYFSLEEKVRALKIDVEGAELDVFKGATRILEHCRPLLVFECENRHLKHGNVFDVFNFLYDFNYRGQFVAQNLLVDIAEFIPEKHQKQSGDRYWDRKEYVNNFIFRPREA